MIIDRTIVDKRAMNKNGNIYRKRATDWNGNTFAGASHIQEQNHFG